MLRSLLAGFALIALAATAAAQEATNDVADKAARTVADRTKKAVDDLKDAAKSQDDRLRRLEKGVIDRSIRGTTIPADAKKPVRFPSKTIKDKAVAAAQQKQAEAQAKLDKAVKGDVLHTGSLSYPTKVGDVGTIHPAETGVNVKQVIDKTTMLIRVHYAVPSRRVVGRPGSEVVLDDFVRKEVVLMVKGVPTDGATNGAGFELPQPFVVTGTKTYRTAAGGSGTVFVVEPLDTKKVKAFLAK